MPSAILFVLTAAAAITSHTKSYEITAMTMTLYTLLRPVNVTSLYIYFIVGVYGFYHKFSATLNQVDLINLMKNIVVLFIYSPV